MGTMLRNALAMAGISAVTVMSTGREIHQKIIQRETPTAWAPGVVSVLESVRTDKSNRAGPTRMQVKRFACTTVSPLFFIFLRPETALSPVL